MSLDDLDQALFEAKWGDAEEDVMEVIARILELPREAVERVIYAMEVVHGDISKQLYNSHPTLDDKLRAGLKALVQEGLARVLVRSAILNERAMLVSPQKLIKDPSEICSGCEWSIPCISNNYSTPPKCYAAGPPVGVRPSRVTLGAVELQTLRNGAALVTPVKITKNTVTVTCSHPRGTFKVAAKDLST
jgi:hypothetical protein